MRASVGRAGLVIALPCCGAPRPAVLPDADLATIVAFDVDSALAVLVAPNDKAAWLARVDTDGRPRWVRPVPDSFAGAVPLRGSERAHIAAGERDAVLRFADTREDPSAEHWLGFSLTDGTPRWRHTVDVAAEFDPGAMQLRADQLLWVGTPAGSDAPLLQTAELVTGVHRFTRRLPDASLEPRARSHVFADYVAVVDAARGAVLLRRSDGVERATLPLAGRVCALGETLIGLHDDSLVAHDLGDLGAPPRVLGEGLADLVPEWTHVELRSCHRRGADVSVQLWNGDTYLLTLGAGRRELTEFGAVHWLVMPPEIGDFVPHILGADEHHALTLFALGHGPAIRVRRVEPLVHDGAYRSIEAHGGGWLMRHEQMERVDLLALDVDGAVTGAARVLGDLRRLGLHDAAAGRLWLSGARAKDGALPLRVLDIRTLAAVAGSAGTLVDLTAEAQAAWLPPPIPLAEEQPEAPAQRPRPPSSLLPPGTAKLRPDEAILAGARALGHTGVLEVLAWRQDPPDAQALGETGVLEFLAWRQNPSGALVVAFDLTDIGPRWTFIGLQQDQGGTWIDRFVDAPRTDIPQALYRRPTRTDVEVHLRLVHMSTHLELGSEHSGREAPSWIDAHRYRELTGRPPRWRTPPDEERAKQ